VARRCALWHWLDERLGMAPGVEALSQNLRKPVPPHVNWLFTLGAAIAALLAVQVFSGSLLMVHYRSGAQEAYPSVERITYEVPLGMKAVGGGALVLATIVFLGILGHLSETERTILGKTYHFDARGWPRQVAAAGEVVP